ncbi:MAG: XRE family transcriptional regulator [Hyphomicrobium sp.]|nr:XRE family transcriptional regulator [Hyphomicrobium sp.]
MKVRANRPSAAIQNSKPFVDDLAALKSPNAHSSRNSDPQDATLETLGRRLRELRQRADLSLDGLAKISEVSKSMISKVERGEASPSTVVLARLAEALGVTFSDLMAREQSSEVIVLPVDSQPVLLDPETGHTRKCLAPILPTRGIDWVLNTLPPGQSTGQFMRHRRGVEEYIHVLKGRVRAILDGKIYDLSEGDAMYFQAHVPHEFINNGLGPCQYYLIIDSQKIR